MSIAVKERSPSVRAAFTPITGDAGAIVDQGETLADKAIEQGRLADIRPADDGDREAHERALSAFTRVSTRP